MLAKCNAVQNCDCPRRLKRKKHILPCTVTRVKRVSDVSVLEVFLICFVVEDSKTTPLVHMLTGSDRMT